jgi:hypothetical protein
MQEASDLREKVVNNRSIIQSTFTEIHHKTNTELLLLCDTTAGHQLESLLSCLLDQLDTKVYML